MNPSRDFDLVLFGATGFTGSLTADYLASSKPPNGASLRWAIAGRSQERLERRAEELAAIADQAGGSRPGLIVAASDDPESLRAMATRTRVVASTVGPYERYGEPLVKACVEAGCDYVDITGEPQFVRRILDRYDAAARDAGLRLVNCCGFDSVPHDLGALLTVRQLPRGQALNVEGLVFGAGELSGGTWHSAVNALGQLPSTTRALSGLRAPEGRKVRASRRRAHYEKRVGAWAAPLPTIDPWIVLRSACGLEDYGPNFRYGHFVQVGSLPKLVFGAAALGGIVLLAQTKLTRSWLYGLKKPGDGPDAEQRAKSSFEVVFFGSAVGPGEDAEVRVEVSGGDPGYGETSKMLAESALCLVHDRERLPDRHGILTPALAFDEVLVERLRAAGMRFEVVESSGS